MYQNQYYHMYNPNIMFTAILLQTLIHGVVHPTTTRGAAATFHNVAQTTIFVKDTRQSIVIDFARNLATGKGGAQFFFHSHLHPIGCIALLFFGDIAHFAFAAGALLLCVAGVSFHLGGIVLVLFNFACFFHMFQTIFALLLLKVVLVNFIKNCFLLHFFFVGSKNVVQLVFHRVGHVFLKVGQTQLGFHRSHGLLHFLLCCVI
mmetsp:Transcript_27524/g.75805  ORF Transcript_27524/g.75805 Transcript_27524/m.75805 type:complete len:204 (-) Transcript_27524:668-1279(-)